MELENRLRRLRAFADAKFNMNYGSDRIYWKGYIRAIDDVMELL